MFVCVTETHFIASDQRVDQALTRSFTHLLACLLACRLLVLFAGSIPTELGQLNACEQLDLRANQLTGEWA